MSTSRQALLSSQCILDLFPPFLSPFFQMDPGQTLWPFDVAFPSPNVGFLFGFFQCLFLKKEKNAWGLEQPGVMEGVPAQGRGLE